MAFGFQNGSSTDGPWSSTDGPWSSTDGTWSSTGDPWSSADGPWSSTDGLSSTDGPWSSADGSGSSTDGPWPYTDGQWFPKGSSADGPWWSADGPWLSSKCKFAVQAALSKLRCFSFSPATVRKSFSWATEASAQVRTGQETVETSRVQFLDKVDHMVLYRCNTGVDFPGSAEAWSGSTIAVQRQGRRHLIEAQRRSFG